MLRALRPTTCTVYKPKYDEDKDEDEHYKNTSFTSLERIWGDGIDPMEEVDKSAFIINDKSMKCIFIFSVWKYEIELNYVV